MYKAATALLATIALGACAPTDAVPAGVDTTDYSPQQLNEVFPSASAPTARITYAGQSDAQYGDLRVPKGDGPFPVAMLVHGGCWNNLGSINNMAPMADWLLENGVASWNVDYRELQNGGGWPQTFVDWAAALSQLKPLAKAHNLDLNRISVIGHSSGVTPAIWLAIAGLGDAVVEDDLPKIRAAVALDGPLALGDMYGPDTEICRGVPVVSQLLGGKPDEVPERYAMVDPAQNRFAIEEALVVVGALPLPFDGSEEAMRAKGVNVTRIDLDGKSHFNLVVPGTPDFAQIAPALLKITRGP